MEQGISIEQEKWAASLAVAMRALRKHGFYLVQDPEAVAQTQDKQDRQAAQAAAWLLGVPATDDNLGHAAVNELAQALLSNAEVGIARLRGRI